VANFSIALDKTLSWEGGYTTDSGGETNYGISKRSYPSLDIKNITKEQAAQIYRRDFWNPLLLDGIKSQSVANMIFDFAVNAGKAQALKTLRAALGANRSGPMSNIDINEINHLDQDKFLWNYGSKRLGFYQNLAASKPNLAKYLNGWSNRAKSFFFELIQRRALIIGGPLLVAILLYYLKSKLQQRATNEQ